MSVCDVCSKPVNINAKKYTANQMRHAVRVGFRPPQDVVKTMSVMYEIMGVENPENTAVNAWINQIKQDTTDWALCSSCASLLDAAEREAKPAAYCAFCKKEIYANDPILMLDESSLNEFVLQGIVKHPGPPSGTDRAGITRWIACTDCMDKITNRARGIIGK